MNYIDYKAEETIRILCNCSYYEKKKRIANLYENEEEAKAVLLRMSEILQNGREY